MADFGHDIVLDLEKSRSPFITDARSGAEYLDFATFYASSPLGMNHPLLVDDPAFMARLAAVGTNKPSTGDFRTDAFDEFVSTFTEVLGDEQLDYLFFVEGGALAVENALKVAFDWKHQKNEAAGIDVGEDLQAMHLRHAFHGRSGYTMSLTNTDENKIARFPKFDWPRIDAPAVSFPADGGLEALEDAALADARAWFAARPNRIACIIVEPIQAEGGDRHLSERFLRGLQQIAHDNDALFVVDEVQTGAGTCGTPWCYQQLGLLPDVVAFAKKIQVGGVMAGRRVREVGTNVFEKSGRISSTWGGGLVDMVRSTRILQVVAEHDLIANARRRGEQMVAGLAAIAATRAEVTQVRGRGLMCAFDLPTTERRDQIVDSLERDWSMLALKCGALTVRLRPPMTVAEDHVGDALERIAGALDGPR